MNAILGWRTESHPREKRGALAYFADRYDGIVLAGIESSSETAARLQRSDSRFTQRSSRASEAEHLRYHQDLAALRFNLQQKEQV